jgi:hypothetical protein
MSGPVVSSAPVLDELVGEDGAVVLVSHGSGHRVVRLSVLGRMIRELAADGIPLSTLGAVLVERLGSPPTPNDQDAVRVAVEALAAEGLVVVADAPSCA